MYRKQLCEASCKQQSMENSPQKRFFNFTLHVFNSNVFGIYRLKIAEREQIENTQSTILRERDRERERERNDWGRVRSHHLVFGRPCFLVQSLGVHYVALMVQR